MPNYNNNTTVITILITTQVVITQLQIAEQLHLSQSGENYLDTGLWHKTEETLVQSGVGLT